MMPIILYSQLVFELKMCFFMKRYLKRHLRAPYFPLGFLAHDHQVIPDAIGVWSRSVPVSRPLPETVTCTDPERKVSGSMWVPPLLLSTEQRSEQDLSKDFHKERAEWKPQLLPPSDQVLGPGLMMSLMGSSVLRLHREHVMTSSWI